PVQEGGVRAMCAALRHRGPDGEGVYVAPGVALGMRRLSIIDLRTGDQPVANEDGTAWVVFNGEIYNYRELRHDLEGRGHRFPTSRRGSTGGPLVHSSRLSIPLPIRASSRASRSSSRATCWSPAPAAESGSGATGMYGSTPRPAAANRTSPTSCGVCSRNRCASTWSATSRWARFSREGSTPAASSR